MKRIALLIAVSIFSVSSTLAQESKTSGANASNQQSVCNLEAKDAPAIFGLKLGMTKDETKKIIGGELLPEALTNEEREIKVEKFKANQLKNEALKNVSEMRLEFFEDKLYLLAVQYQNPTKWNDAKEFSETVSTEFQTPANWKIDGKTMASLFCKGFNVYLSKNAASKLTLESRFTWIVISDKLTQLKNKKNGQ